MQVCPHASMAPVADRGRKGLSQYSFLRTSNCGTIGYCSCSHTHGYTYTRICVPILCLQLYFNIRVSMKKKHIYIYTHVYVYMRASGMASLTPSCLSQIPSFPPRACTCRHGHPFQNEPFVFSLLFVSALLCCSCLCSPLSSLSPQTSPCSNMPAHSMPSAA